MYENLFGGNQSFRSIIDDCAKDGGKEFITKIHCILQWNSYRIFKDS